MIAFLIVLGIILLVVAAIYVHDVTQTEHTILRNFPIIGHVRYFAEQWGEYMRQYQYLPDWEERPFNRLERSWVYRSAKGVSNLISFGSSATPIFAFRNAPFPVLEEDCKAFAGKRIGIAEGPGACRHPYLAMSFFNVSGMSFGALSPRAVSALSRGAAKAGVWMSTGEGGLSPYHLEGGGDIVFQIGTAKYGVRNPKGELDNDKLREIAENPQVKMIEIKLAQGAKPGKGGMLPGVKVTEEISRIRGIEKGKDSISPNRHSDIGSIAELGAFVKRVRDVGGLPVGCKIVVGDVNFLDEWFADCKKNPEHCPDYLQVDGGEGGTGAAPAALAESTGLPITMAVPMVVEARARHGLTDRIRIVASGKLITPDKVAWALCMGCDFVNTARGFMFSLGCIQAMKCASGECPTGVTSTNPRLIRGLDVAEKAERVAHYIERMRHDVEMIAHSCGCERPEDLRPHHVTEVEKGVAGFRATGAGE
ncbi:MAG: FMN-binding glutamate synthase family protein [Beijerinckiaceae bacterium]